MKRTAVLLSSCSAALFMFFAPPCLAQATGGATSLQLDPSIRASGMGHASSAVFWGLGLNDWANPALLGYERGIRIEHQRTQLVPGVADDVFFTTDRVVLGAYGIGVSLGGKPIKGLGRTHLTYGMSDLVDDIGNPRGQFESWEDVWSWGAGVSLSTLADSLAGRRVPMLRKVLSFGDIALGITRKRVEVDLAPDWVIRNGRTQASAYDAGILVRLTPYNSLESRGLVPELDRLLDPVLGGFRVDLSGARSWTNYGDEWLVFRDHSNSDPMPRASRRGLAGHFAVGFPGVLRDALGQQGLGLVAQSLTPLVEFGWGRDRFHTEVYKEEPAINYRGWELTLAGIYTLRKGHIENRLGHLVDNTSGWGLGLHLGRFGALRYDEATEPQALELGKKVWRHGWTAQIDPLAIWTAVSPTRSK